MKQQPLTRSILDYMVCTYKSSMIRIDKISSYTTYKSNSESMSLLIDVLLAIKNVIRICHCATKAIKSPFLRMNNLIIVRLEEVLFVFEL